MTEMTARPRRWTAWPAIAWSAGYTLLRLYWAAGGTAGYPGHGGIPTGRDLPAPHAAPGPPDWLGVAAGLALLALAIGAALPGARRVKLWAAVAVAAPLAYLTMPMLLLDLLRLTPYVPVGLDGTHLAARLVFGAGALCWITTAAGLRAPAGTARFRPWIGYLAAAAPLPYMTLKTAWALGSTVGWPAGTSMAGTFGGHGGAGVEIAGWGTVAVALIGIPLALALVRPFGRRLPRWMPLAAGWFGTALLVPFVPVAVEALVAMLRGSPPQGLENWVFVLVYGGFGAWGVLLGAATRQFQRVTRVPAVTAVAVPAPVEVRSARRS